MTAPRPAAALLALALAAAAGCSRGPADGGGPLSWHAAFSANGVPVGWPVTLTVTADYPADARLELPEPGGPGMLVLDRRLDPPRTARGRTRVRAEYRLVSFDPGTHAAYIGEVAVVAADGAVLARRRPDAALRVESLRPDPAAPPRGPRGALPAPPAVPPVVWVLPLIALLAAAITGAAIALRRRAARPRPGPPRLPPHARALAALEALRAGGRLDDGDPEPLYRESSAIVRGYIEERFGLRAPESTTEEFLRAAAESRGLDPAARLGVAAFLEACDLVKFARHQPDRPRRAEALDAAVAFVRATVPAPAPPPEATP